MTAQKFELVDLTGDGHGHHIPGTPIVFRHGWIPVSGGPGGGKKTTQHVAVSSAIETHSTNATARSFAKATHDERRSFYKEQGIQLQYPEQSDEDLLDLFQNTKSPEAKKRIRTELQARAERLSLVAEAVDRAALDARRKGRKESLAKLLERVPAGAHIQKLADKLLTDKALDKVEGVTEAFRTHGKEYAGHMAIVVALSMFLGPLGGAIGGAIGGEAMEKMFHSLMHDKFIDAALWVGLAAKFERYFGGGFEKLGKAAKAERAIKHELKVIGG